MKLPLLFGAIGTRVIGIGENVEFDKGASLNGIDGMKVFGVSGSRVFRSRGKTGRLF